MKKIGIVLLLFSTIYANAQLKSQPRLHNWITTFMPKGSSSIRHVIVLSDGTLRSWKPGETPAPYLDIDNVSQVSAGTNHLLILKKDGTVWALGENGDCQLGNEQLIRAKTRNSETPVKVTGLKNVIAISAFRNNSYALLKDGTVWAWGGGGTGLNGDGGKVNSRISIYNLPDKIGPVKVVNLENVIAISGAMALLADGTIWTWGDGSNGRLGNGSKQSTSTPVKVQGITNAVAIATRYDGAIALLADGTIKAWGNNYKGQLGNGAKSIYQGAANAESLEPVKTLTINNAIDISAWSSCLAMLNDGTVKGWGWGMLGALGPFNADVVSTPLKVYDLKNIVAINAGNGLGFALQKDGTLLGWGSNMVASGPYLHTKKVIKIASFGNLAPKAN